MDATQTASNEIDGLDGLNDDISNTSQSATNVANSISAEGSLAFLVQNADVDQAASNVIDYNDELNNVSQDATNAANIATFDTVSLSADQFFDDTDGAGAAQVATNVVDEGSIFASAIVDLTQSATNVINSLSGTSIANGPGVFDVEQTADTLFDNEDQIASNFVSFGSGGIDNSALVDASFQSATNVVNTISVEELNGSALQETVHLDQDAINLATGTGIGGGVIGTLDVVDQSATNASNLITASTLPNLAGVQDITQTATTIQTLASNTLVSNLGGGVTNFAQSAVNVANSVGLPSAP